MIEIKWSGRFANCAFQMWSASVLARNNRLPVNTRWPLQDWVRCSGINQWDIDYPASNTVSLGAATVIDDNGFEDHHRGIMPFRRYEMRGYFQRMDILHPYVKLLRELFDWKTVEPLPEDHICIHCRLGDHGGGRLYLDPQWYVQILERESFKKLSIYCDDPHADGYMDHFKKFNPAIKFSPNAMDDFDGIRRHQRIIIGPSSYAVLACLTGHAKKVYQWSRDQELPHIKYQLAGLLPGVDVTPVYGKFWREVSR